MPNTNPQAILVVNEKLRPLADALGQVYNRCKMAQDEYNAENWLALFPADAGGPMEYDFQTRTYRARPRKD